MKVKWVVDFSIVFVMNVFNYLWILFIEDINVEYFFIMIIMFLNVSVFGELFCVNYENFLLVSFIVF